MVNLDNLFLRIKELGLTAKKISDETGLETFAAGLDISNKASVECFVNSVVNKFGRIDILVNNAGICPHQKILEMDDQLQRTVAAD